MKTLYIVESSFLAYTDAIIKATNDGYILAVTVDPSFPYPNAGTLYDAVMAKEEDNMPPLDKRSKAYRDKMSSK